MKDLAPEIYRQRLVIEGVPRRPVDAGQIATYLSRLSDVLQMHALMEPVTHWSPKFGWAGWLHWETSGAHLYAWDEPMLFFSVDIYTCKPFQDEVAVRYTEEFFEAQQIVHRNF
jgi:S-adenosylmethionine decarboxylase